MSKKLLILSSTPRTNAQLAREIEQIATTEFALTTELVELESLHLPLYTPDLEGRAGIPAQAIALKDQMLNAWALVILAPEYNGGLPPVLVNAISWISRTGENWREAFQQKPVMIGTVSGGGGVKVMEIMASQLRHLGALVLPRPVIVTSKAPFRPEGVRANLTWLTAGIQASKA